MFTREYVGDEDRITEEKMLKENEKEWEIFKLEKKTRHQEKFENKYWKSRENVYHLEEVNKVILVWKDNGGKKVGKGGRGTRNWKEVKKLQSWTWME